MQRDNTTICWPLLLDLEKAEKYQFDFEAVVGTAEVKLMNHNAEAHSCDSGLGMISNISQYFTCYF